MILTVGLVVQQICGFWPEKTKINEKHLAPIARLGIVRAPKHPAALTGAGERSA